MSAPITQPFATMESAEIVTDPMSVGAGLDIQEITATMSSMSASRTLARMMEPATTWSMITLVLVFQDLMELIVNSTLMSVLRIHARTEPLV